MNRQIPAVSIVIPMYNAEKFIAPCLESILAQTFRDFEVIVVDHCSTDNSHEIVESYVPKFTEGQELRLVRLKVNVGNPYAPRNKGLNLSRGKYVFFMDADDLSMNNALADFHRYAESSNADVVYTYRNFVFDKDASEPFPRELRIRTRLSNVPERAFFAPENPVYRMHSFDVEPWLKFSRRDLLIENDVYFPRVHSNEDNFWTRDLIFSAGKILMIPDVLYINREDTHSVTRKEKSTADFIRFIMYSVVFGPQNIERIKNKHEILREKPQLCYDWMTGALANWGFNKIFSVTADLRPYEIYKIFYEQFAEEIGENAELVSYLCSYVNTQQKILALANQRIAELEQKSSASQS